MVVTKSPAVLLVDVVNHMQFPGGGALADQAAAIAPRIVALRRAAHAADVPVIYANDNFSRWHSTSHELVHFCTRRRVRGATFTRRVAPTRRDFFVLKAKNSAFYCTALEPLLESLKTSTLILAGLTADNCVLFTAHDAYLRDYQVIIAEDAVASETIESTRRALKQMQRSLKARVVPVNELHL